MLPHPAHLLTRFDLRRHEHHIENPNVNISHLKVRLVLPTLANVVYIVQKRDCCSVIHVKGAGRLKVVFRRNRTFGVIIRHERHH